MWNWVWVCKLEDQVVDIFTMSLKIDVFKKLKIMRNVIDFKGQLEKDYQN